MAPLSLILSDPTAFGAFATTVGLRGRPDAKPCNVLNGSDGTRTRGLRRDRPAALTKLSYAPEGNGRRHGRSPWLDYHRVAPTGEVSRRGRRRELGNLRVEEEASFLADLTAHRRADAAFSADPVADRFLGADSVGLLELASVRSSEDEGQVPRSFP